MADRCPRRWIVVVLLLQKCYINLVNREVRIEKERSVRHREGQHGRFDESLLERLERLKLFVGGVAP